MRSNKTQCDDSDYSPGSTTKRNKNKNKKQRNRSTTSNKQNKKRKHRDIEDHNNNSSKLISSKTSQSPPPKKRQKVSKRPSKKPTVSHITKPNSHITITFANINGTIDAIILPKQNVLAMNSDILLENKGKLSIKTSDPIQNDITPQIPMDIEILTTPNIKTIHPRNSFRMGTSLFYCSDEERLFWSFPLRNTRRVSCQHYCCVVSKIVTRSVGIHSNKCNGNHSEHTPCIYAVCNGKPPKGIIPAKLFANYQYFQHSAKTELLVPKDPNDEKFKKVPNTNASSTMYQNIKVIQSRTPIHTIHSGPPLAPMEHDTYNTYNKSIKHKYMTMTNKIHNNNDNKNPIKREHTNSNTHMKKETIPIKSETDSAKRRRQQLTNNGEPIPFQQNVQIDLKALSEKKQKLRASASNITSSSSIGTEPESHDYSELLLHSTSSVIRDAQHESENEQTQQTISIRKQCKQLLLDGEYDDVISTLKPLIPAHDFPDSTNISNTKLKKKNIMRNEDMNSDTKWNDYRLLMATALYYRDYVGNGENDSSSALHFCNLIVSNCMEHEGDIQYYEARKIRGLIHKKLRNYKAACHDFEFICYNNPYHRTWRDKLYSANGKSNFLENKVLSPKHQSHMHASRIVSRNIIQHHRPPAIQHRLLQQGRPNPYHIIPNIPNLPPPPVIYHANANKLRLNEIITTHHHNHINVLQNNNYYPPNQPIFGIDGPMLSNPTLDTETLNRIAQNMVNNAMNVGPYPPLPPQPQPQAAMDITNPNAPIIFIPPIMDRKSNNNSGGNTPIHTNNSGDSQNKADKLGINLSDFHIPQTQTQTQKVENKPLSAKALLDINYSDLAQIQNEPKAFPERSTSNTSFEGLLALAHAASTEYDKKQQHKKEENECENKNENVLNAEDLIKELDGFTAMKRKTTREELLGETYMNANSSNDTNANTNTNTNVNGNGDGSVNGSMDDNNNNNNNLSMDFPNIASLHKTVSTTPEPLERIRSDALARNSSQ